MFIYAIVYLCFLWVSPQASFFFFFFLLSGNFYIAFMLMKEYLDK